MNNRGNFFVENFNLRIENKYGKRDKTLKWSKKKFTKNLSQSYSLLRKSCKTIKI